MAKTKHLVDNQNIFFAYRPPGDCKLWISMDVFLFVFFRPEQGSQKYQSMPEDNIMPLVKELKLG